MTAAALPAPQPLVLKYQSVVNAVFATFVFFGMLSLIEPSPYDFLAMLVIPIWAIGGFRLHRFLVPILCLWIVFEVAGFLALMPYWYQKDVESQLYQWQSLYLFVTVVFFTIFFSERTTERATLCLKAFTLGCIVSAIVGFLAYFGLVEFEKSLTTYEGRVSGTFKDPNVFGSYLILGVTYLLQVMVLGRSRHAVMAALGLVILLLGVFISFSRGSWGANIGAMAISTIAAYLTADSAALRLRIVRMASAAAIVGVLTLGGMLSVPSVRDFFLQRAEVTQEYDEGPTGRFGNQIRSIPMLIERPEGFGPLRFRSIFGLEPHNSYIGGFANGGWLGGFAWIGIVSTSLFVGFRVMFKPSPFRRLAQVYVPTLTVLLLQGLQIDVDHWRQLFLCFGAVWGLETARLRWLARQGVELQGHELRGPEPQPTANLPSSLLKPA